MAYIETPSSQRPSASFYHSVILQYRVRYICLSSRKFPFFFFSFSSCIFYSFFFLLINQVKLVNGGLFLFTETHRKRNYRLNVRVHQIIFRNILFSLRTRLSLLFKAQEQTIEQFAFQLNNSTLSTSRDLFPLVRVKYEMIFLRCACAIDFLFQ